MSKNQTNQNVNNQTNNISPEEAQYNTSLQLVQLRQMTNANLMQENSRLFVLVFFLIVGVFISLANYAIIIKKNTPPYYVTVNENNQYLEPIPLYEPMYKINEMKVKSMQATEKLMSYNFTDYITQININRPFFSEKGWESYNNALKNSQTLEMIRDNKMIVNFKVRNSPTLIREGVLDDGRYAWEFELRGEVQTHRQDPNSRFIVPVNYKAKVKIIWVREGIHKYEEGIAIQRYELVYE